MDDPVCRRLPRCTGFFVLLLLLVSLSSISAASETLHDETTQSPTPSLVASNITADATTNSVAEDEESSKTLLHEKLAVLEACGWLVLLLYTPLSLAVAWRTSLHFLHSSRNAKKAFHVMLLVSTLLQLPEAIEWICYPMVTEWKAMYVCRLYPLLLLSFCKSYLAICWAGVVAAGQLMAQRRTSKLIVVFNSLLLLWGVVVSILLCGYRDDGDGQYSFMGSKLRVILLYSGVVVVLTYGILLGYQGFRLRRRLLHARGTVLASSVEKSLNQLMLAIVIFIVSDMARLLALVLNLSGAAMSMIVHLVLYSILPNVLPTICMLYLMRRVTGRGSSHEGVSHVKVLGGKYTLSEKHLPDSCSDESSRRCTGSDVASYAYNESAVAGAEWDFQNQPRYLRQQQDPIYSTREARQAPALCWVHESTELC
uniref:RxLR effector candidate protein n=1 Tax=Peronospora matthiolae TaxID=2874970 RepID=A0AAV1TIZ2_9STRA